MEEKYFERFFNIEQGLENNGYVELKDKIEKELNEIKENGKLINMYQRVKLKLNKYEAGITEKPILPFIKLIFNPLCSVLLTLGTVFLRLLIV